jgi:hypothetical protein
MPTGNADLDRLDNFVEAVAQGRTLKLHEISLASQSVENLARQLRALTTCGCGAPRMPGDCPNFCERDE